MYYLHKSTNDEIDLLDIIIAALNDGRTTITGRLASALILLGTMTSIVKPEFQGRSSVSAMNSLVVISL